MAYKNKSDATAYQNKFIAKAYDRVNLTMPKGKKEIVQACAEAEGESVNAYINKAIDQRMERDGARGPQAGAEGPQVGAEGPQVGGGVFIPPDTLERAQQAAEATGEAIADFLARAVETQAKRDRSSLAMGISPATKEKEPGN